MKTPSSSVSAMPAATVNPTCSVTKILAMVNDNDDKGNEELAAAASTFALLFLNFVTFHF